MTLRCCGGMERLAVVATAFAACSAAGAAFVGCSNSSDPVALHGSAPDASREDRGITLPEGGGIVWDASAIDLGADCDPTRSVDADGPALLERDPVALTSVSLERVLRQLLESEGASTTTPLELIQRLFDTMNSNAGAVFTDNIHCDDPSNEALHNGASIDCPRAEGALAKSTTLLTDGSADSFFPVAIVNRFDRAPRSFQTCGEHRIVFAKESGRTEPQDRVFIIFEGALENPVAGPAGCRPIAEFWASLQQLTSAEQRGVQLEQFLFVGLPGFAPLVSAKHFGLDTFNCDYTTCGQVRVGLGMQSPWSFREFQLRGRAAADAGFERFFGPVTVKNNPMPALFDLTSSNPLKAMAFRSSLQSWAQEVSRATAVPSIRMRVGDSYNAGESIVPETAQPSLLDRIVASADGAAFLQELSLGLESLELACPITYEAAFQRITALTCAGCHAPTQNLSPTRALGCDLVFPPSLGLTHIDESGALSEALSSILLPHRADVLSTYLQACDATAILEKFPPPPPFPACFVAGTPITMADGSLKPIEQVAPGDLVLAFDTSRAALVPGEVRRSFVHPNSHRLVVINETLVATANHPFYSDGRWIRADALAPGSSLLAAFDADPTRGVLFEAGSEVVRQVAMQQGSATTYNLEVAVQHNYFAGGVLVHNKP